MQGWAAHDRIVDQTRPHGAVNVVSLNIEGIPAFDDNYIWTLRDGPHVVVVDPGDADPVLEYLAVEGLTLSGILLTHHHPDHVGGVEELLGIARVPVYGPRDARMGMVTHPVQEGGLVTLPGLSLSLRVLEVPGHTSSHVAYAGDDLLFCGDTLFACGCGRLFEGSPAQMLSSLDKLARLPQNTRVYCAHEYTLSNVAFALAVEPDNPDLAIRASDVRARRQQGLPTVPSLLSLELVTNPFLRCHEPDVIRSANTRSAQPLPDRTAVFATLREWKNRF